MSAFGQEQTFTESRGGPFPYFRSAHNHRLEAGQAKQEMKLVAGTRVSKEQSEN